MSGELFYILYFQLYDIHRTTKDTVPKTPVTTDTKAHQLVGSAKRDVTHPTAIASIILAIACSENVRARPCIDLHGQVDRNNNTTPDIYVMHRSLTRKLH